MPHVGIVDPFLGNGPISRYQLGERSRISGSERAVDTQIARLRRKLEPEPRQPRYLLTKRGEGYVLRPGG
jgi:two-component system phosphate regulon response regulator OmpR